ncbi:LacI family DNA-binding transcriptional regulator [Demequina pelophila]|uniref:LacI family DNA-binding transcriptional regulator n=1 Tax=Demequina pelophila TaxID=1638984 RepID=UPI000783C236|nr:LacI family DNA-binding transcriptional regulator [Demequina pelophila]
MPTPADARRKPTIRDVAAVAGVSRGTVSRVLNGGRWVSPEAQAAVEKAIETTGYQANHHARSLATGRANSVAFLLTEPHHLLFEDPTFSRLLRGALDELARRSMTLVLLVAGTADERARIATYVTGGHVDGVMLISAHESDPLLDGLIAAGVPTVTCGAPLGHLADVASVAIDEVEAARTLTRHLISQGHRRIGMITGPPDTPGGRYRLAGFREELGERFTPALVAPGDYSRESGRAAMRALLAAPERPDAVFAASDLMALGALETLREAGLRTPEDVAVAGFDDAREAATANPPLTTVHQPFEDIAAQMVDLLVGIIDGGEVAARTLPGSLVVRDSA